MYEDEQAVREVLEVAAQYRAVLTRARPHRRTRRSPNWRPVSLVVAGSLGLLALAYFGARHESPAVPAAVTLPPTAFVIAICFAGWLFDRVGRWTGSVGRWTIVVGAMLIEALSLPPSGSLSIAPEALPWFLWVAAGMVAVAVFQDRVIGPGAAPWAYQWIRRRCSGRRSTSLVYRLAA